MLVGFPEVYQPWGGEVIKFFCAWGGGQKKLLDCGFAKGISTQRGVVCLSQDHLGFLRKGDMSI